MLPTDEEIRRELDRLSRQNILAPQERQLLHAAVAHTLRGNTGQLYQKALAQELNIESAKQIGVLATRIRSKLGDHYRGLSELPLVEIQLTERGYEAQFTYLHTRMVLDGTVR